MLQLPGLPLIMPLWVSEDMSGKSPQKVLGESHIPDFLSL